MSDTIDTQPKQMNNFIQNNENKNININENKNINININENKNDIIKDLCSQYTDDYYNCMKQFDDFKICIFHFDNIMKCLITQEQRHSQGNNP